MHVCLRRARKKRRVGGREGGREEGQIGEGESESESERVGEVRESTLFSISLVKTLRNFIA